MKFCDVCHATYPADFTTCPRDQAPLRSTTELQPGMVLRGKYEIEAKIGAGGMATVYRARHLVFNEPRAIKIVSSRLMDDENFLKRFRNEAVVTRKLQHPNAVRVEDMDTMEDGRPFIVMELVEGQSLRSLIEKEGPLPPARALEITRQVASALGAAHSLGIVHRDIKPDNIVLTTRDGVDIVKVLDFGIAKLRDVGGMGETAGYTTTQTGMLIGTPQYISPEQASGKPGEQLDGRSDIYSLGIVLYQMLTGRVPFESDTPMGVVMQHMQTPPPTPQSVRPDLKFDNSTTELVLKCLEKDPAKRFQMAQELIASIPPPGNSEDVGTKVMVGSPFAPETASPQPVPTPIPTVARTVAMAGSGVATAAVPAKTQPEKAHQGSAIGGWIAAGAAVLIIAAGGYFYTARQSSPNASPARAVSQPAATKPAALAPVQPQPEAAPPETPRASSSHAGQERRVKELIASGRSHMDNGEYALAIRDLREAVRIAPDDATAQATLKRAQLAKRTEEKVLGARH